MERHTRSLFPGTGVAVVSVAAALLATMMVPGLRTPSSTALFFAAVMVSSWYAGLFPGLLATALSALAVDFFVVPPAYSFAIGLDDVARISVFVVVAVLISSLNTARRRLEHTLRERAEQLAVAHAYKDRFLATLAHELRSPLGAIINAMHVLRICGGAHPPLVAAEEIVERQTRQLTRLVDDLLDLSRIGQGKLSLHRETVDASSIVALAVETIQPILNEKRHQLKVVLPPETILLHADSSRLAQILVNLLTNAARYTDPGGRIVVTVECDARDVLFRVRDTGVGLSQDALRRIFDPFVQVDSGSYGGLGLGLNLVRGLAELHGGSVTASSSGPGQGSEFVLRLPAPIEADPLAHSSGCTIRSP